MGTLRRRGPGSRRGWWSGVTFVALALLLLAGCAVGGATGGQTLSQQGSQRVLSLAVDHFHPQLIYAGGDSGTVFNARGDRSVLFANKSGIPSGVSIATILPDTQTAGVVYAGTSDGVYKTSDFGQTWRAIGSGLPSGDTIGVLAFAARTHTLLAGTVQHGVYSSADGGAIWTASNAGLPAKAVNVNALLSDPNAGVVYLAMDQVGLFSSTDDGQRWQRSGQGIPSAANTLSLTELLTKGVNSAGPTLYAGTSRGLFTSTDGGAHWTSLAAQAIGEPVTALATDPAQPGALYAGTATRVLRSMDGGATWTPLITSFSKPVLTVVVVETGGHPVVFATNDQVYRYPALTTTGGSPAGAILFLLVLLLVLATGFWAFRRVRRQMSETLAHQQQQLAEREAGEGEKQPSAEDDSPSPASRNGHRPG
ncbi:MAG TPA: hypothetical protein VJN88_17165 [Ktedonobacterales bacterium]|nr:hypothetical protein [Ktedonobacterales bacterium]